MITVGIWIAAAVVLLPAGRAKAQYQVFAWENLEGRTLPDSLRFLYNADQNNVVVADYMAPGVPAGMLNGIAAVECGRYGLRFDCTPDTRILAVVNNLNLDRSLLGQKGRALYQADFYLPAQAEKGENVGVLAVSKPESAQEATNAAWRNYRVGILDGDKIYYSYTDGQVKKGSPVDFKSASLASLDVSRPGWHRLQLIFEGQDKIICAVDGKACSFSPIIEPTLVNLQAGIMVTVLVDQSRTYYADNLSIQWTPDDLPLPDSPWVNPQIANVATLPISGMPSQPATTAPGTAPGTTGGPTAASSGELNWFISPDQAWDQAKATGKPVLTLFYTPRARAYQSLDQTLQTDPSAKQLISKFTPLRLDVNQLRGGSLAQQYNLFRVPTFLVIGLDAKEKARVTVDQSTSWAQAAAEIQRAYTIATARPQ